MEKSVDKRDRRGARAPEDLKREYNFAGMKEALELCEKRIEKLEKFAEELKTGGE